MVSRVIGMLPWARPRSGRARFGAVLVVALLGGCSAATSTHAETDQPPQWFDPAEVPEATISFEDGPALAAATDVRFHNNLGDVYDWDAVGEPTATRAEFANAANGCRVLDATAPYAGAQADDRSASMALVEASLADTEPVAGPDRRIEGIGEGLGEGGPTYDVAQAIGRDADGHYVFVTARVFTALGVQHSITVTCAAGQELGKTRAQLTQVAYAYISDLPRG